MVACFSADSDPESDFSGFGDEAVAESASLRKEARRKTLSTALFDDFSDLSSEEEMSHDETLTSISRRLQAEGFGSDDDQQEETSVESSESCESVVDDGMGVFPM